MNQHKILLQHAWNNSAFPGVQISQVRVLLYEERSVAREGVPVTQATLGTDQVTQQFVVMLGTLENAVTHVAGVQAHGGSPAAVEPRTPVAGASFFIFSPWTIVHPVAEEEDGETVAVGRTAEVGLWALHGPVV